MRQINLRTSRILPEGEDLTRDAPLPEVVEDAPAQAGRAFMLLVVLGGVALMAGGAYYMLSRSLSLEGDLVREGRVGRGPLVAREAAPPVPRPSVPEVKVSPPGEVVPKAEAPKPPPPPLAKAEEGAPPPSGASPSPPVSRPAAVEPPPSKPPKAEVPKAPAVVPKEGPAKVAPPPKEKVAKAPPAAAEGAVAVQVMACRTDPCLEGILKRLRDYGFDPQVLGPKGTLRLVRIGPYPSRQEALKVVGQLKEKGLSPIVVKP